MGGAFLYAEKNNMETEADYGYQAKDGTCHYDASKGVVKVTKAYQVRANDEAALKSVIAEYGPVSVAVEADKSAFQLYQSGVLDTTACGTKLDHGVLAVGYGTEGGKGYFLVKNSWGPSWGDKGYLKIASADNTCGILMQPVFPVAEDV